MEFSAEDDKAIHDHSDDDGTHQTTGPARKFFFREALDTIQGA